MLSIRAVIVTLTNTEYLIGLTSAELTANGQVANKLPGEVQQYVVKMMV